ncbi:hypothetical protein Syun_014544 [Stephania yunnanensis]|uniref:Uncharacterized protein n=1 Tax=Stephania yunnanensis TaxID=152371 RepID=A0AAP0JK07_9MAGN
MRSRGSSESELDAKTAKVSRQQRQTSSVDDGSWAMRRPRTAVLATRRWRGYGEDNEQRRDLLGRRQGAVTPVRRSGESAAAASHCQTDQSLTGHDNSGQ